MSRNAPFFLGVDLGGTNITAGVVDNKGKIEARARSRTRAELGFEAVTDRIVKVARKALSDADMTASGVEGLGIGAPGTIDFDKGVVHHAVNLRWNEVPLAAMLKEKLRIPVTLDNDVNVGAWGEHVAGAGRGFADMFAIFVGTGIGGGLVLGGELYHGHFGTAGEIGHTVIHGDAPLGRRTFENCASRTAVVNLLKQMILANHPSKISDIVEGDLDAIRSSAIAEAIDRQDELTCRVVQDVAHYVGVSAANIVTLLSLPCVVIGGGLTEALPKRFVKWVRKSFRANVYPPELGKCRIAESKLGDDAGITGAALLARSRLS